MNVTITDGGLDDTGVIELLGEHMRGMLANSPPESVHALDVSGLKDPAVTFWAMRVDEKVVGCGALKELDAGHGEIKSMRTSEAFLRKGLGRRMLEHIIEVARHRGYRRLSLETGSGPAFEPAHALYLDYGFAFRGPFADYTDDPFSRFMELVL